MTYFDKALAIDPENEHAVRGKAVGLTFLGRYNEALSYYDRAIGINASNIGLSGFLIGKGTALAGMLNYEDALTYFDKALDIEPTLEQALKGKNSTQPKMGTENGSAISIDNTGSNITNLLNQNQSLQILTPESGNNQSEECHVHISEKWECPSNIRSQKPLWQLPSH